MAHRFIIDDSTGALYSDFTCRRLTSAADILKSERGLSPTLEIYLVNVATDTRAVTGQTLTNADLDIILGSAGKMPDEGIIKIGWNDSGTLYESGYVDVKNLSDDAIAAAFNSTVSPVTDAEGINVDNIGEGKWLLTMKKVGAISGNPTFDVEGCNPPSAVEVSSIRTGDSNTKGQWIISIAQSPVASISGGSFSAVTSGSFSGLTASISLNTTAMIASISRGIKDFELSITHSNQLLHRSPVSIHESLDPTTAGTLIISSPSLFTLGSNAVNQGETIALSGGLTYDGTTLAAPFLPLAGGTMTGNAVFNDNVKAIFGTSSDGLEIYNSGADSVIADTGTGDLIIQGSDDIWFRTQGGNNYANFNSNGSVDLYYSNSKKFETTSLGATISGKLIINGDLDVSGTTTTFNSSVVTVDDPVFTVGGDTAPVASDNKDRGIEFRYFRSGESAKVGFFGYDNSENAFTFFTDATNNSEVFSGTLGNLKAKDITLSAGTLQLDSAYAIQWGNGNNRIFGSSGNNYIRFDTNGTEAARFDSSGRFAIGETTPSAYDGDADDLIVKTGGNTGITIRTSSTGTGSIFFADGISGSERYQGNIRYFHSDNSLRFATLATEAARIDSSGHLLVNTTTSSADVFQSLATDARYAGRFTGSEIVGSSFGLRVRAGYTSSDLALIVENRSGTDLLKIKGDGSSHFYSPTTNTVATFESGDPGAGILLADDTGTSKIETSGAEFRVSCDDDDSVSNSIIKFRVDGGTRASIDSTGNFVAKNKIKIEHGTPVFELNDTSSGATTTFTLDGVSTTINNNGTGGNLIFSTQGDHAMTLDSSQRCGIGTTSPSAKLDIYAAPNTNSLFLRDSSDSEYTHNFYVDSAGNGHTIMYAEGNAAKIAFSTSGDSYFNSGNVGIGTTSPSQTLTVDGTARITGHTDIANSIDISGKTRIYDKLGIGAGAWIDPSQALEVAGDIFINGGAAGGRSLQLQRTGATNPWKLTQGHTSTDYFEILEGSDTRFTIKNGGTINIPDDGHLTFGGSSDLHIYHDGANSYIDETGQGDLIIKGSDDVYIFAGSDIAINCNDNSEVSLWYNNVKKAETTADGFKCTGALRLTEISTPTATADHGKIYTKSDNKLYFQDGAGTEHEIAFV